LARDVFEFVLIRVVVPAAALGAIGGIFYVVERCSAEEPTAEAPPSEALPAPSEAGAQRGEGGLTAEQRERIRRAIARLDGGLRRPEPILPKIPAVRRD
jgi:hypothetical protein